MDNRNDNQTPSKSEEATQENKIPISENAESLERVSLVANKSKKRNYFYLGGFLCVLLIVGGIVVLGGKDKKNQKDTQAQDQEFESTSKKQTATPEHQTEQPKVEEVKGPSQEEIERLKKEEALNEARRKSAIVTYNSNGTGTAQAVHNSEEGNGSEGGNGTGNGGGINPNSQNGGNGDPNTRFQREAQSNHAQGAKANFIGGLDKQILQGKLIDAVLETAINSDLPGMVRAIVSYDVYAEAGNQVLIPRGSRLVGQYNSQVQKGQTRVFVIWDRVIRPDGVEVAINSGGTDSLGRSGLDGRVNTHFWKIFGTSTLLSILSAGTALGGVGVDNQYNSIAAYRQEVANSFNQSGQTVLGSYANIPPTIQIKQGKLIKVFVARDLDFTDALAYVPRNGLVMIP